MTVAEQGVPDADRGGEDHLPRHLRRQEGLLHGRRAASWLFCIGWQLLRGLSPRSFLQLSCSLLEQVKRFRETGLPPDGRTEWEIDFEDVLEVRPPPTLPSNQGAWEEAVSTSRVVCVCVGSGGARRFRGAP